MGTRLKSARRVRLWGDPDDDHDRVPLARRKPRPQAGRGPHPGRHLRNLLGERRRDTPRCDAAERRLRHCTDIIAIVPQGTAWICMNGK